MDNVYNEFVGVDSIHTAIITKDTETEYSTEPPEYFAPAAEITGEPETENTPTYYDNAAANNYVTEGVTPLSIVVSGIPADKYAKYLGKHYDAATGRVYDNGKPKPPNVALSFRFDKGYNGHRYYQYLKGTFSGGAEEATSKTNTVDVKTYSMTYTAVSTTHKWIVNGEPSVLKRVFADTNDAAFDPAGWFNQVQTPDTVGAPDPVSLSTIIPNDAAIDVETDANIVLTFNNKITSEGITLFNADTAEVVAVEKSWDATGKILTMTTIEPMSVSTKYLVSISGVKDVYGQLLANSGSDFTTAVI